jgi:hypothetical protein
MNDRRHRLLRSTVATLYRPFLSFGWFWGGATEVQMGRWSSVAAGAERLIDVIRSAHIRRRPRRLDKPAIDYLTSQ